MISRRTNGRNGDGETRERLLRAGVRLFGLHGYEATSTRALAAEAGVNLAAIPYHFGGKEQLYHAVLEHIVAIKLREIGGQLDGIRALCADPAASRRQLLDAMAGMVRTMVAAMLGNQESQEFSRIMMQEQIAPTAAFGIFHDGFLARIHGTWAALLARLTGLAPDSTELRLRALSFMGQLVVFRVGMSGVLRLLQCDKLSDEHLEGIARLVIQQMEAAADGFAPVWPAMPADTASESKDCA